MVDATTIYLLAVPTVIQLILSLGAVYYAYRITGLLGSFLAWTMIIVAFLLLTLERVSSLALTFLLPPESLAPLLTAISPSTLLFTDIVNVGASLLLLLGVRGLYKTFQRQSKKT